MPGFSPSGGITSLDSSNSVIFSLKSSNGEREIKTYRVPSEKADEFAAGIRAEEPSLRQEAGETDPLMLIKISKCF